MFDYQNQPGAAKPPRMSRVNWTQATTTTLAAAVGCLLAIGACLLLYRYMLGNAIRVKQAKLDELTNRIDDLSYKVVRSKPLTSKPDPVVGPSNVDKPGETQAGSVDVKADDELAETEKAYVPRPMPGEVIETTKAV